MHRTLSWVASGTIIVIRLLPLSICFAIGQLCGLVAWIVLLKYRRLARKNITHAFLGQCSAFQVRQLVLQHFITTGANLLSALKTPTLNDVQLSACFSIENEDVLLSCLKKGKGIVMAISHIGNWELFSQLNFLYPGVPTGAIYQPLRNKWLNNLMNKDRSKRGVVLFNRQKGFSAPIAMLRQGGIVGILVDQHAGDGGIWTPFFRKLASTSPLAATLACRTGATVLPAAIFTDGLAHWRIAFRQPISYQQGNFNQLTADINCVLESQIQESPKDWFWVHDRWKIPDPDFLLSRKKRGTYLPKDIQESLHPFRILVRSSNWLGDAVMSVPTVQALKRGRLDARIAVLTSENLAALWHTVDAVDEVIVISKGETIWGVARKLHGCFEIAVLLPNSLRCALEAFLAGIPRRVGYRGHYRVWLLNQVIKMPKKSRVVPTHHSERYLHIAETLGASSSRFFPLFSSRPTSFMRPVVTLGLCPGAAYGPAKCWPADRFRKVIEDISEQTGYFWKIFGTAKDCSIARVITTGLPSSIASDYTGRTGLSELISELFSIRLLLTNDTGVMHLAALLGVPVVAIFGSTEPLLTSPFGVNYMLRRHVECSPCFLRKCPIDFRCMKAINTETVKETVLKLLNSQEQH